MSQDLVPYNDNKGIKKFDRSVRAVASYVDQAIIYVDTKYYAANSWGIQRQIEADMILEYKLGLSRGRNKY